MTKYIDPRGHEGITIGVTLDGQRLKDDNGVITRLHRYSGWPGAYCLDCGASDPAEEAIAHGCLDMKCNKCGKEWPTDSACPAGSEFDWEVGTLEWFSPHRIVTTYCPEHGSEECLGGSRSAGESSLQVQEEDA